MLNVKWLFIKEKSEKQQQQQQQQQQENTSSQVIINENVFQCICLFVPEQCIIRVKRQHNLIIGLYTS